MIATVEVEEGSNKGGGDSKIVYPNGGQVALDGLK